MVGLRRETSERTCEQYATIVTMNIYLFTDYMLPKITIGRQNYKKKLNYANFCYFFSVFSFFCHLKATKKAAEAAFFV